LKNHTKHLIINRILPIIVFGDLFIYYYFKHQDNLTKEEEIHRNGRFLLAKVYKLSASKGGSRSVYYKFRYNNKPFTDERYVSREFYKKMSNNDTIIIKVLAKYLPFSNVCENISYSTKHRLQPKYGWKNLPK